MGANEDNWQKRAAIISEALPFLRRYCGHTLVIKYGGHVMLDERVAPSFAQDIALLKLVGVNPVVVHGGGPQIGRMLTRLRIKSRFVEGLRVTDKETAEIVEMVLSGAINKQIASSICAAGGQAIGISGKDGNLIKARKLRSFPRDRSSHIEQVSDMGFVGEPYAINSKLLRDLVSEDVIPVIAPIGVGADGETYNINADTAAGAIAGALGAKRLLLLTDVCGVRDCSGGTISELTVSEVRELLSGSMVSGGMVPKLRTCLWALSQGVSAAVIVDGRVPHAVLLEAFTQYGAGTLIRSDGNAGKTKKEEHCA